jgi:hypothetical protein
MKINGVQIQHVGPNAGGYSLVYWGETYYNGVFIDLKANLQGLIDGSNCNESELFNYFARGYSEEDSKEILIENIGCLGDVEFGEVFYGTH